KSPAARAAATGLSTLTNCDLNYPVAAALAAGDFLMQGSSNNVSGFFTQTSTLTVQGNGTFGTGSVNVANFTNSGTVFLDAIGGGFTATIGTSSAGSWTNAASGTIEAQNDAGGPRIITGNLTSHGSLIVDAGIGLTYQSSTLTTDGSVSVAATGSFSFS